MATVITNKKALEIDALEVSKSDIAESLIILKGRPFSFRNHPLQKAVTNCDAHEILYYGGRQIGKSTYLGTDTITDCLAHEWLYTLFVAPSLAQVKEFSNIKVKSIIDNSPLIQRFVGKNCVQNVYEKSFSTNSRLLMKALSQLESIRGIEANKIREDEIQDATLDELRMVEIVLDGQEEWWKFRSGTAKTLNNPIEYFRKRSKQIVPVLRCPECGYHNLPSVENIKSEGLMCRSCKGGRLIVRQPYLTLQCIANPNSNSVSFWVPQIILPLHVENPMKWAELYRKRVEYPVERFLNEVMGISAGSAFGTITEEHLQACCRDLNGIDSYEMYEELPPKLGFRLYMGLDWGITQSVSFTVATIAGYNPYTKRFTVLNKEMILDPNPDYQVMRSFKIARHWGVSAVIPDYGSGFDRNYDLKNLLKPYKVPVYPMHYVKSKDEIYYDEVEEVYKVDRTKSLTNTFRAIRKKKVQFFSWNKFKYFAPHFLAEKLEFGVDKNGNPTVKYDHDPDDPDDSLHSLNVVRTYVRHLYPDGVV